MEGVMKQKRTILLIAGSTMPFLGALCYFVIFKNARWVQIFYAFTKVFTLIYPLIALHYLNEHKAFGFFKTLNYSMKTVLLGVGFGVLLFGLMLFLMETPMGEVVRAGSHAMKEKVLAMGIYTHFWLFAILLSTLHSLLEEYYWRWFLFGQFRKIVPGFRAHLLAGVAFSAHHLIVTLEYFPVVWAWFFAAMVGIGGICWSYLYEKTHSLLAAWLCHMMVDFGIFWVGYRVIFSG
jgi:membrane protease YdiL (CAAX protease family)